VFRSGTEVRLPTLERGPRLRKWLGVSVASTVGALLIGATAAGRADAGPGCACDCDGDGHVTVEELVVAVNIALGQLPLAACPAADRNGDSLVTVDEIVIAVSAALQGCATPLSTASPTPTPTPSACVTRLDPQQVTFVFGGSGCFDVIAPSDCCWDATPTAADILIWGDRLWKWKCVLLDFS
jgi:hypothetical protein